MAFTPFRQRAISLAPGYLKEGTGERFDYMMGLCIDAQLERAYQCTTCHFPLRAGGDALDQLGQQNLLIQRGLTEGNASYGVRLQHAFETWGFAGDARGLLMQVLGYFLTLTPAVRIVASRYAPNPAVVQWQLGNVLGVAITAATNANPIVLTTFAPHGLFTGDAVTVTGARGNTAANGPHTATVIDETHLSLGVAGNGVYTGGGRIILTSSIPASAYKPLRLSSTWDSYPVGRSLDLEPEHLTELNTYVSVDVNVPSGVGNLDWDGGSPVSGSYGWWGGFLIIESVAPNAWTQPAPPWGAGSVYTGSGDYSTVTSGGYVMTGSYAGTSPLWGVGSTYNGTGDYSKVATGGYDVSSYYSGASRAWGLSVSTDYVQSVALIAEPFKNSGMWLRAIVVCFDPALFDSTQGPGFGINPDGYFGNWSRLFTGGYNESRFVNAVYGGEVL